MVRKHASTICLVVLAFGAGLAVKGPAPVEARSADRVYELRTYTTAEGKLPNLLARFGGGEIDLFTRHGMTSVGYWVPDDPELSENTMVYMLAHESREAAAASWRAFAGDPDWQEMSESSQVDGRILIRGGVKSMFLNPTDFSPAR
ncbi:MAG: NIPSNAP family protein [Gemmatimonadota bacterium]|nr:NIPSNAP family protein [Gemmatimonadota bacterium]